MDLSGGPGGGGRMNNSDATTMNNPRPHWNDFCPELVPKFSKELKNNPEQLKSLSGENQQTSFSSGKEVY